MSKRGTITITAPLAAVGDTVHVLNYRMHPSVWESGEVTRVWYHPEYSGKTYNGKPYTRPASWHYAVFILRPESKRGGYTLEVGDEGIQV